MFVIFINKRCFLWERMLVVDKKSKFYSGKMTTVFFIWYLLLIPLSSFSRFIYFLKHFCNFYYSVVSHSCEIQK